MLNIILLVFGVTVDEYKQARNYVDGVKNYTNYEVQNNFIIFPQFYVPDCKFTNSHISSIYAKVFNKFASTSLPTSFGADQGSVLGTYIDIYKELSKKGNSFKISDITQLEMNYKETLRGGFVYLFKNKRDDLKMSEYLDKLKICNKAIFNVKTICNHLRDDQFFTFVIFKDGVEMATEIFLYKNELIYKVIDYNKYELVEYADDISKVRNKKDIQRIGCLMKTLMNVELLNKKKLKYTKEGLIEDWVGDKLTLIVIEDDYNDKSRLTGNSPRLNKKLMEGWSLKMKILIGSAIVAGILIVLISTWIIMQKIIKL